MEISTKGRYALWIMMDLAAHENEDEFIPLRRISGRQNLAVIKYLEQIVAILQKAGFVKSLRGNAGGYKLSKPAKDYTVGEILRLTEGSLAPVSCLYDSVNQCERSSKCIILPFWIGLQKTIDDYVDGVTLLDLISGKCPDDSGDASSSFFESFAI